MRCSIALCGVLLLCGVTIASGQDLDVAPGGAEQPSEQQPVDPLNRQRELEAQLAKTLSGATLVGQFNVTGAERTGPPLEDRYDIVRATKLLGDVWLFVVRIRYGQNDLTVPLTIPIKWAGETPVITVDNLNVPGLGTYDARVMIHRGHYAGTWFASDHGGLMSGRIERTAAPEGDAELPKTGSPDDDSASGESQQSSSPTP